MAKLRDKQEKFCQEYIVDWNATQAAIRAGYSEKTAHSIGHENLSKPEIKARIEELKLQLAADNDLTPERIFKEYARLAFFDIRKIYNEDGSLKQIHELDDDTAAALVGLETTAGMVTKYKMADKKGTLDSVAKILDLSEDDTKNKNEIHIHLPADEAYRRFLDADDT